MDSWPTSVSALSNDPSHRASVAAGFVTGLLSGLAGRPGEAREIYDALAGRKQLRIFHGVGHQSLVRAQPDEWRSAVTELLASLGG